MPPIKRFYGLATRDKDGFWEKQVYDNGLGEGPVWT